MKMPVETALPFHCTVRGSPTLTEMTLIGLGLPHHLGFSTDGTHAIVEYPSASLQKNSQLSRAHFTRLSRLRHRIKTSNISPLHRIHSISPFHNKVLRRSLETTGVKHIG